MTPRPSRAEVEAALDRVDRVVAKMEYLCSYGESTRAVHAEHTRAIATLRRALDGAAPETGEPVAWVCVDKNGKIAWAGQNEDTLYGREDDAQLHVRFLNGLWERDDDNLRLMTDDDRRFHGYGIPALRPYSARALGVLASLSPGSAPEERKA